jgi:hypothetical protein
MRSSQPGFAIWPPSTRRSGIECHILTTEVISVKQFFGGLSPGTSVAISFEGSRISGRPRSGECISKGGSVKKYTPAIVDSHVHVVRAADYGAFEKIIKAAGLRAVNCACIPGKVNIHANCTALGFKIRNPASVYVFGGLD